MITFFEENKKLLRNSACIFILPLLALVIFARPVNAALEWVNPQITGEDMKSVFFIDNNTGYAVGATQRIIKTTDGGSSWEEIYVGDTAKTFLNDIYFVDSSTGFAVGDSGTVLKTTDSGANWGAMFAGTGNDLNAIVFTATTTGYIVGNGGKIAKTTTGTSWSGQTSGVVTNLTGIDFPIDSDTGFVTGDENTILKTNDGGTAWAPLTSAGSAYNSVAFNVATSTGFAVGASGEMYKTTDSGSNWAPVTTGVTASLYDIVFATQSIGFAVGATGTMLGTSDSGATWAPVSIPTSNTLYSIQFPVDTSTGYAVGAFGEILKTIDGGATWTQLNTSTLSDTTYSIQFPIDTVTGYAAGPGGKIFKSTDSGVTWISQPSGTTQDLHKIYFPSDVLIGYAVGDGGTILKTIDGGTAWTALSSGTTNHLYDVSFPDDPDTGYVAGETGLVLKTSDGGANWSSLTTPTAQTLYAVYFPVNPEIGYAAGQAGTVIKTINSGLSWSSLTSGTAADMKDIHFPLNATSGAIVGGVSGVNGTIISTVDGGANWTQFIEWTTDLFMEEVFFPYDTTTGYVVTSQQNSIDGMIYKTTDGGVSWNDYYYSYDNSFYSVYFPTGENKGFISGNNGFILMESNSPADVTAPLYTNNQADAWFSTYTGLIDIDFSDAGGGIHQVQARACSISADCGDVADWTVVMKPVGGTSYTSDWYLPKFMWDDLQEGSNYLSVKVIDKGGNQSVVAAAFNMMKDSTFPSTTDDWTDVWTATPTVVVTLTPSDTGSGVAATYSCVDTANSCVPGNASTTISVTASLGATAVQYVRYYTVDTAGNSETVNSKRVRQDREAPSGGSISYTGGNSTVATSTIIVTAGTDTGSGISLSSIYRRNATYSGGSCGSYSVWVVVDNSTNPSWSNQYSDTSVASGNCYQYKYTEQDITGNIAEYCTDGTACSSIGTLIIDTTGPSTVSALNDGAGADVDFSSSTTSMMANWSAATDPETGIMAYYYSVGSTSGASDVVSWTSSATDTSFATSGLSLSNAGTYYSSVKAVNNWNIFSTPVVSDGVTIDTTGPSAVSWIYDGTGADVDIWGSSSSVSANWAAASDSESGIGAYWYGIGSTSGGTDILTWTSAGTATSVTATGISLTDGNMYYMSVKPQNNAGIFASPTTSDGFSVAATPPSSSISSPSDGAALTALTSISGTASDSSGSGLSMVQILIGASSTGNFWSGSAWGASETWLTASGTTSWSYTSPLPTWADDNYIIKSKATSNSSSVETPGAGVSFSIDNTAPAISITSPADGSSSGISSISVSGTVEAGASVSVNSQSATVNGTSFSSTVTATEGSNTIIAVATDATGNAASDSVTITVDLTAPTAQITSPTDGASVSGTVTITGTASDDNFSSYLLEYGAGASPSTWQTVSSMTSPVTSQQLGSANMTTFAGTYTFKLTVTDSFGTTSTDSVTVTVSNTITESITVSSLLWTQISIPMTLDASSLNTILDASSYKAYYWNPNKTLDPVWQQYETPTSLSAGQGLWVKAVSSNTNSISLSGSAVDTTSSYEYSVSEGWNQIGTPYSWDFTWSNISVKKSAATYTLSEAVSNGYIASAPFYYESSEGQWLMVTSGLSIEPGTGYMIDVTTNGVTLVYDPGDQDTYTGTARVVRDKSDLEIMISAAGSQAADPHNLIGLNRNSNDGYDGRDMREPPRGMNDKFVSLYFPHQEWTRGARYTADYRGTSASLDSDCSAGNSETTICKTWDFNVDTNESGTDMKLSWNALSSYSDMFAIKLTDISTGSQLDMTQNSEYTYSSDGSERSFRIEVAGRGAMPARLTYTFEKGWNLISIPIDPEITDAALLLTGIDVQNLLQHFEGRYFSVNDEEGVDIQAGLGYWIYLDTPISIEIEGLLADPYSGLSVPLSAGWNLVGNPFDEQLSWADNIKFTCNGAQKNLSDATAAGWTDGKAYSYDNAMKGYSALEMNSLLSPWKGYFLRVADGCSSIEFKK